MAKSWLLSTRNSLGQLLFKGAKKISVDPIGGPTISASLTVFSPDLKPEELSISKHAPYQGDLLSREDFGDGLSKLIDFGSGTGVVLIDGGWGSGKTTFLRMWVQKARNQGKVVAMVNAWDGDYRGNPLEYIADRLATELEGGIPRNFMIRLVNWTRRISASILLPILQTLKAWTKASAPGDWGARWVAGLALQVLIHSLHKVKGAPVTAVERLENLRLQLEQTAGRLRSNRDRSPRTRFVVVIDELDRCRPDYAVRFLETIKHVFEVKHVTFVVAANITELARAMGGVYGEEFDGEGYLERFFDITLRLPEGTRGDFVTKVVQDANLSSHFGQDIPNDGLGDSLTAEKILTYMLYHSTLSSREIHKTLKHIQIMLLFHRDQLANSVLTAIVLAALRSVARDAYQALERGEAGSEAVHLLCRKLGKRTTSGDPILELIDDILYWCQRTAEQEVQVGERVRREEPESVETVAPSEDEQIRQRRSARENLVEYRAVRDAIELTAAIHD